MVWARQIWALKDAPFLPLCRTASWFCVPFPLALSLTPLPLPPSSRQCSLLAFVTRDSRGKKWIQPVSLGSKYTFSSVGCYMWWVCFNLGHEADLINSRPFIKWGKFQLRFLHIFCLPLLSSLLGWQSQVRSSDCTCQPLCLVQDPAAHSQVAMESLNCHGATSEICSFQTLRELSA